MKINELTMDDKVAYIKNWVEELHQDTNGIETTRKLLEEYRNSNNRLNTELKDEKILTNHLNKENTAFRNTINEYNITINALVHENEKLKNSKSLSEEEVNKLVNDKIASIFSNPLTYLMSLPITERNELIGRIYTAIIGVKFR